MFNRVLIACVGNICRSPMAEAILRQQLAGSEVIVESAGLAALVGKPIDPLAGAVLAEHGLSADRHVARQLKPELIQAADLVLVMEKRHLRAIHAQSAQALGKTFLLGKWQHDVEIPDPYGQPKFAFRAVYGMVCEAADAWRCHL
jgi:protein-tyrosine phosphatase